MEGIIHQGANSTSEAVVEHTAILWTTGHMTAYLPYVAEP